VKFIVGWMVVQNPFFLIRRAGFGQESRVVSSLIRCGEIHPKRKRKVAGTRRKLGRVWFIKIS
jgi:hypothetical protein